MFETLCTLTEMIGPTGEEDEVIAWLRAAWEPHVQEMEITPVGNLIAHVGGSGPLLLIEAHADEIGYMVKSIDPAGYLWITTNQMISVTRSPWSGERLLIGQPVVVLGEKGKIDGIFESVVGHISHHREAATPSWETVWIDIGATSKEEAEGMGVRVGSQAVWRVPTRRLNEKFIYGKAMDDRGGVAIITELLQRLAQGQVVFDLYVASTVQEEIGLVGAASLAAHRKFDYAIALEVGLVGDVPFVGNREMPTRLGAGPILVWKDGYGVHYNRPLTRRLWEIAHRHHIPVQSGIWLSGGSNGQEYVKHGIATASVTFPTRYTDTPTQMVMESDLMASVDLLTAFLMDGRET